MNDLSIKEFFNIIKDRMEETLLKRVNTSKYIEYDEDKYNIYICDDIKTYNMISIRELYKRYKNGLIFEVCVSEACNYINDDLFLDLPDFSELIYKDLSKLIILNNIDKRMIVKRDQKFILEMNLSGDNNNILTIIDSNDKDNDLIIVLSKYYYRYRDGEDIRNIINNIYNIVIDFNKSCFIKGLHKERMHILLFTLLISLIILFLSIIF